MPRQPKPKQCDEEEREVALADYNVGHVAALRDPVEEHKELPDPRPVGLLAAWARAKEGETSAPSKTKPRRRGSSTKATRSSRSSKSSTKQASKRSRSRGK